jgi:predicted RNA methylase
MSLNSIRFLDNIAGTNHNFGMQLFHDSVVYGNIYQIYDLLKEGGEDIISMLYARAWSEIYKFLDLYQFPFKDNDGQIYKKRISGVQPVPLKIEVDIEKLSKIQFSIDNDQLAGVTLPDGIESPEKLSKNIIENPLLLWQKSRDLPRYYRSSNFKPENCEFSKMPDSSLIEYLFSYEDMDIVLNPGELYSNCKIRWNNKFKWPASIDAYFLLNTLLKHGYAQKQIRTMADIGCGTGVIGICLALWNENVQELMCSDIDDILLKVATYNANMNLAEIGRSGFTFNSRRTSGIQFLISEKTKYDVLILTPPYLPQPQELDDESSFLSKFTDGTALLENIIRRGLSVADELILEFSSMAKLEFDREIKELGEKYKIKTAKLGEMKVPLRLPRCMPFHPDDYGLDDDHEEFNNVLKDYNKKVEYHQKILIKDRNSLKMLEKRNFKYYHTLYAYSVTR